MTQPEISFPDSAKGYSCPCCGSYVKTYRRSMNSNMAIALICLLKSKRLDYVHMEEMLRYYKHKRCGDFSYLVHYRFIEKLKEKREDGSKKNGKYKITTSGIMWAEGKTTCKSKFLMEMGKFKGFDGEDITIMQALGEKFSYDRLISDSKD